MTGQELYKKLSKRDYSGSAADLYAQLLQTLFGHIQDKLFPYLEQAESDNKQLDIDPSAVDQDEYQESDIILI
ncbi:hypothetical protein ACR79R_21250 [Sphingobacterium spiritivorum]|uniref:hypothetical protein n=1 Tax=Sphingobacterium spiritivorum TaxID=258 RepID=UPI003DA31859